MAVIYPPTTSNITIQPKLLDIRTDVLWVSNHVIFLLPVMPDVTYTKPPNWPTHRPSILHLVMPEQALPTAVVVNRSARIFSQRISWLAIFSVEPVSHSGRDAGSWSGHIRRCKV